MTEPVKDEYFWDMYDPYGGPLGLWMIQQGILVESQRGDEISYEELLQQELNDSKGG